MRAFNTALLLLALLMAVMAGLPLLGLDLIIFGKGKLVEVSTDDSNLHLFMVRSAAFATFASFTLNYLRGRRPLSSVAPLLYFCVWASIFAPAYIAVYSNLQWRQVAFVLFTATLALILFRENERESKTIFVNEW